jgi:hypothetical protein
MTMRLLLALPLLIVAAACGQSPEEVHQGTEQVPPPPPPPPPPPTAPAAALEQGDVAWTGRFAASPELCTGGVWDIRPDRIVTDGETSCAVRRVGRAAGQVTVGLTCNAEGMTTEESWTLTPGEGDRLAVSRSIPGAERIDVDLRRCG